MVVAGGAWETPRLLLRSEIANSSGLVGRYLMYHFQTYVVGSFPFRLHGHRGRSVTHLHDDHMIIDDESRAFAEEHALPYFRAGIVEHGGGGHPVLEAMYTAAGPAHTRAMLESPMRDRLWAFTIQGEDLPQVTNRIDLDPGVRDVYGFPAGRATYDVHPHEVVASRYYAPKLAEIMREAGAETTFSITSPRLEGDRAAPSRARRSRVTSWGRAAWATTRARASSTAGSDSTTSRTCCAPTRRCSPRRPATARRSRSSRSRSVRAASSPVSSPLRSERVGAADDRDA